MTRRAIALSGKPFGASPFSLVRGYSATGVVFACIAALAACEREVPAPSIESEVAFRTADGVTLAGTLYAQPNSMAPGILLIHGLGEDRTVFSPVCRRLLGEGYTCLAVDLRGHGQSLRGADGEPLSYRSLPEDGWHASLGDVEAAYDQLALYANPGNRAVVGSALGANLALALAERRPDVRSLALLSPGAKYGGVRLPDELGSVERIPMVLMAAEGDSYSASAVTRLKAEAPGYSELRLYPGTFHGAELLGGVPDVPTQLVEWLDTTVLHAKTAPVAP